jgi:effector-binding domain-containing protein
MSDRVSDADYISDPSNAHVSDDGDGAEESSISSAVRELCDRLRANNLNVMALYGAFVDFQNYDEFSEDERVEIFQALEENSNVKNIRLCLRGYTK